MTKKTKIEKLTRASVAEALLEAKIDEMGKKYKFAVVVEKDSIEIIKKERVHLRDVFIKRDMSAEDYAKFVIDLITKNMLH